MLHFFRKMRKALIPESRFGRYFFYALGEIVLVVIGILIALQVNNWNEQKKQQKREVKLLNELRINLQTNVINLTNDIDEQKRSTLSIDFLLNHLDNKLPYNDSLPILFQDADFIPDVTLSSSAFEIFKSVGFEIIRADKLRKEIIDLFEIVYPYLMLETKRLEDQVWPAIVLPLYNKHFRREIDKAIPVHYNALLHDTEITNMLSFRKVMRINSTKQKMIAKNKTEEVIRLINEYLSLKDSK